MPGLNPRTLLKQLERVKGVYKIEHFKMDAYDVHTNKPAPGAYRAPGAPQATFAGETQLNKICAEMDWDPAGLVCRLHLGRTETI